MTDPPRDPDRLAEVKARRAELDGQIAPWARPYRADIDWLVGEVERLRGEVNHLDRLRWSEHGGELGNAPWQPPYPQSEATRSTPREG
jgi:hypothetical protein